MNGHYFIYKMKTLLHSLVYIIKQDYPLKVDSITNIIQTIIIVDYSSSDSSIRMLTPGSLPTIIGQEHHSDGDDHPISH